VRGALAVATVSWPTNVTTTTRRPTLDELVERTRALLPRWAERAAEAEALRHIPRATIDEFRAAGLFLPFVPARYGGYEMDYGPVQLAISGEIGKACGSSSWVQSVLACHAWVLGMYPEPAQDAVWSHDPNTIVASAFAPSSGITQEVEGGYVLDGVWQFSSGVEAAEWLLPMMVVRSEDRTRLYFGLVNRKDFEVLDTWHAAGLRATGSNDVRISDAFVPHEFALDVTILDGRPTPGSVLSASHIYRLPLWTVFGFNIGVPALGIARGAIEAYIQQTATRPDNPIAAGKHARIAESSAEVDAAETLLQADVDLITRLGREGQTQFPLPLRTRLHRDLAYAAQVCARAVDRLTLSVGAHNIEENNPVHRASRDVHAVANHVGLQWDTHAELYGRVATGLEPIQRRAFPIPI
jgi:3-hydroxy-9,10-secoandrosta-1,3,5(10)-triene-9,17-dione monooxygenase